MQLPGRLRTTTLGDLLGTLHRGRANGTLELSEDAGRTHRVHLTDGLVVSVDVDGTATTLGDMLRRERLVPEDTLRRSVLRAMASHRLLGEVLVTDFNVSPAVVGAALRRQIVSRLQVLEQIADARIGFRVAVRTPRNALDGQPLGPNEFLAGRRRARDRATSSRETAAAAARAYDARSQSDAVQNDVDWAAEARASRHSEVRIRVLTLDPDRSAALYALGLPVNAEPAEIKRAYRRLARNYHPDLHPHASDAERRKLQAQFAAITEAYQKLSA